MSVVQAQQAAPAPQAPGGGRGGQRGGGAGGAGAAQNTAQAIVPIKPGLYMVTGAGANTMVRVTDEGILVVDTKQIGPSNYDNLMAQIRTVSDKPVKFVVIGDVHQDKSGNTAQFVDAGATVIAHVNEKKGLETYTNPAGKPGAPNADGRQELFDQARGQGGGARVPLRRRVHGRRFHHLFPRFEGRHDGRRLSSRHELRLRARRQHGRGPGRWRPF